MNLPDPRLNTRQLPPQAGKLRWRWRPSALFLLLLAGAPIRARQKPTPRAEVSRQWFESPMPSAPPTPLAQLVREASQSNPQILAARRRWQAAEQVPSQVSTLPDPQVTVQQFAVGSPRPFAGFSNSDFAYIGFGVSQDFPYPGKLRLRGEAARRQAAASGDQSEAVRRKVIERLKADYYRLAYYSKTLAILRRDETLLAQIEKIAESHYRVGQGNQQDVLKAQLERTRILQQIVHHHEHMGLLEARIKQLLNRPPDSPDITPEPLTETTLPYTSDQLLDRARDNNPEITLQRDMVRGQSLQVELARKDFYPDFNVQYMWQHTAAPFRDYYVLTLGVRIPIWRSRKQRPELAQATEELDSSRRDYEAATQQAYSDVEQQYLAADAARKMITIYRQGLIPQSQASFQAGVAAYETGREDFESLLSSFLDVLNLNMEYWQTVANHEIALAEIERLTGVAVP
jgi:cobalt-zinc-cadmium efflux system outer membrane protein